MGLQGTRFAEIEAIPCILSAMCEISFRDFEVCLLTSFGFGGTGGGDVGGVVKGELVFRIGGGKVEGRTGGCATE